MTRILPLLLALLLAPMARADQVQTFATCTGRLSAFMEHQWLMQDPGSERTRAQRDAFADLLQAAAPDPARALALRIEAKAAMASALQAADLGGHPETKPRLMLQVRACLRLLPQA